MCLCIYCGFHFGNIDPYLECSGIKWVAKLFKITSASNCYCQWRYKASYLKTGLLILVSLNKYSWCKGVIRILVFQYLKKKTYRNVLWKSGRSSLPTVIPNVFLSWLTVLSQFSYHVRHNPHGAYFTYLHVMWGYKNYLGASFSCRHFIILVCMASCIAFTELVAF